MKSKRERLPQRHTSRTIEFDYVHPTGIRDHYFAHVAFFDDEEQHLAEVNFVANKPGSTADNIVKDFGALFSLALQHGMPPHELHAAVSRSPNGEPAGPLGAFLDMLYGQPPVPDKSRLLDPQGLDT